MKDTIAIVRNLLRTNITNIKNNKNIIEEKLNKKIQFLKNETNKNIQQKMNNKKA